MPYAACKALSGSTLTSSDLVRTTPGPGRPKRFLRKMVSLAQTAPADKPMATPPDVSDWSDAETESEYTAGSNVSCDTCSCDNAPMLCHSSQAAALAKKILREMPSFSSFQPTHNSDADTLVAPDTRESHPSFELTGPTPLAPPPLHHKGVARSLVVYEPADAPGLCPRHSCFPCRPCNDMDDGPLIFPF